MKLDVPLAPHRGQTRTAFVKRCATGFVHQLRDASGIHRSIIVPKEEIEPFMQELLALLTEKLPDANIRVSRPDNRDVVRCAIWL